MTPNPKIGIVVLAAGRGTRLNANDRPKVMFDLLGKPVLAWQVEALKSAGFKNLYLVVGHHGDQIKNYFGHSVRYIEQTELLGTGHALRQGEKLLAGRFDSLLVSYGDHPLWTKATFQLIVRSHLQTKPTITLATITVPRRFRLAYGRVIRDKNHRVLKIIEQKDADPKQQTIREMNPGLYLFNDRWLWPALHRLRNENAKKEYYLTDAIELAVNAGQIVQAFPVDDWQEGLGINTADELKLVEIVLRHRLRRGR